jgi:hypothetical protein
MSGKDFSDILSTGTYSYPRTGNSLSHKPVAAVEGSRPSIQRVAHHVALLDWPS